MKNLLNYIFKDNFERFHDSNKLDKKVVLVFVFVCICLMLTWYIGNTTGLINYLKLWGFEDLSNSLSDQLYNSENPKLYSLMYWAFMRIFFYFLVPATLILVFFKESLKDYGLDFKKLTSGYKIYIAFFLFMVPLVLFASTTDAFQHKYPFYKPFGESLYPYFFVWQICYLLQFFALEFFFRGFIIHGTKHKLGFYSIFLMTIPYMMIHFQKPFLETTGAIIAGIFLGALSLRSKSIWQGVFIHYSVAITMDIAALYHLGYFD